MDQFITNYQTLSTAAVGGFQRIGVLSIPLVLAIAALVNYFGGERAMRAVASAVGVLVVLTLVLNNATSLGNWINAPTAIAGAAAAATAVPAP